MNADLKAALEQLNATVDRLEAALSARAHALKTDWEERRQIAERLDVVIEAVEAVLTEAEARDGAEDPAAEGLPDPDHDLDGPDGDGPDAAGPRRARPGRDLS